MTALLVSVRDAAEARDALAGGADLIDVKEPRAGSLGAAAPETIAEIVGAVAGRRPLSVALGELATGIADLPTIFAENYSPGGIQFAKIGLAGCAERVDWIDEWQRAISQFPARTSPVAVVYADWEIAGAPPPDVVIEQGLRLGCRAMLVDTFEKRGPGLLGLWSTSYLSKRIAAARNAGMFIVLAGQIKQHNVPQLLPLEPDFIAVRGAVCRGDRAGRLDPVLVQQIKRLLNPPLRITRPLTASEQERLERYRVEVAAELPDLQVRNQLRKEASEEPTLSGELRRAIHASELSLAQIASQAGVAPLVLDEFLTGERTLRSDVLDRLAAALGYELHRT